MKDYRLRAHHGMCLAFFKGKGYSEEFTFHMARVKNDLENNPNVKVVCEIDDICSKCPNNKNSECFIYNSEDLEQQYNFAETVKNRFKYIEVNTEEIQDRFDISDLKIKLADKLTSASYSFYILKKFLHFLT